MGKSSKTTKSKKKSKPKVPPITREEILAARKEFDMTQEELACEFGVTPLTVSRWENENNPVAPDAPGAIRKAIEYMRIQRVLDTSELLRSLDQRAAHINAMRKQIEKEQKQFLRSRSKTNARSRKNGTPS